MLKALKKKIKNQPGFVDELRPVPPPKDYPRNPSLQAAPPAEEAIPRPPSDLKILSLMNMTAPLTHDSENTYPLTAEEVRPFLSLLPPLSPLSPPSPAASPQGFSSDNRLLHWRVLTPQPVAS